MDGPGKRVRGDSGVVLRKVAAPGFLLWGKKEGEILSHGERGNKCT